MTQKEKTEERRERKHSTEKLRAEHVAFMKKLKAMPVEQQEKKEKLKIKMIVEEKSSKKLKKVKILLSRR